MSWLRVDDGFTSNAKVAQLSDGEFRVWMRLLCHCARSGDPSVDHVARREVSGLTAAKVTKYASLQLVDRIADQGSDRIPDRYEIHDWIAYQAKDKTGAERQARWRSRQAPKPKQPSTRNVTPAVTESLPRVRARARDRPVPSPVTVTSSSTKDPGDELAALAGSEKQLTRWRAAQSLDPARVAACLAEARAKGSNVGAYLDTLIVNGSHPKPAVTLAAGAQGTRSRLLVEPKFKCPTCRIGFNSVSALEDHGANVHGDPVPA